tara:strand:- start:166 stop:633 length:468 start_codon:yes stop_codon:yes gene_type:complete
VLSSLNTSTEEGDGVYATLLKEEEVELRVSVILTSTDVLLFEIILGEGVLLKSMKGDGDNSDTIVLFLFVRLPSFVALLPIDVVLLINAALGDKEEVEEDGVVLSITVTADGDGASAGDCIESVALKSVPLVTFNTLSSICCNTEEGDGARRLFE